MKYIINENTYFLVKKDLSLEIMEEKQSYQIEENINEILNDSCKYYGSSYDGRKAGTKYLLPITSKVPIFLNEKKNIVIFPIESDRNKNNIWFVFNNILSYKKVKNYVEITFKNNEKYIFLMSFHIFKNQMIKCSQLISIFLLRE